jgi:hypothetical protein
MIVGGSKVDCLLLLRYYHIIFYSCSRFILFAEQMQSFDTVGLGESPGFSSFFPSSSRLGGLPSLIIITIFKTIIVITSG